MKNTRTVKKLRRAFETEKDNFQSTSADSPEQDHLQIYVGKPSAIVITVAGCTA